MESVIIIIMSSKEIKISTWGAMQWCDTYIYELLYCRDGGAKQLAGN